MFRNNEIDVGFIVFDHDHQVENGANHTQHHLNENYIVN